MKPDHIILLCLLSCVVGWFTRQAFTDTDAKTPGSIVAFYAVCVCVAIALAFFSLLVITFALIKGLQ